MGAAPPSPTPRWPRRGTRPSPSSRAARDPAAWRYEEAVEATLPPPSHAVHESRIRSIMSDIERLREERLPKAFELEQGEDWRVHEIARVSRAMADSAARIRGAEPVGLDAEERHEFLALAARLEELADGLADDARALTPEQRSVRLSEIDTTCRACHTRFRIPADAQDLD